MNAMLTPYHLMHGLAGEMRALLSSVRMGDERDCPINVYEQALPISTAADDEPEYAPYCIVRVADGSISDANAEETVNVILLFCVRSERLDMQGCSDVLHLMQLTKQYLLEHPVVASAYSLQPGSIQWALQEERSHPYYIGGVTAQYQCPAIIANAPPYD